jgi:hemerythrin-like domain-containing protein
MSDVYTLQFEGLVTIHRAIDGALQSVVDAAADPIAVLVQRTRAAAGFLMAHHDAESDVLFPALRRYGRLRSTDVSALDARDREHRDLHELCDRLAGAVDRSAPAPAYIAALAAETRDRLRAHVAEEEQNLAAARLREMVSLDELAAINLELEAFREKAQARLAKLAG